MRHIFSIEKSQVGQGSHTRQPELDELLNQLHELSAKVSSALQRRRPEDVEASPHSWLVADILRFRKQRNRTFGGDLFGEPAWDILLELYTAGRTRQKLSVSGACYSSGVPLTTALRWVTRLEEAGWIFRIDDPADKRRSWLELSDDAERKMSELLNRTGSGFL